MIKTDYAEYAVTTMTDKELLTHAYIRLTDLWASETRKTVKSKYCQQLSELHNILNHIEWAEGVPND